MNMDFETFPETLYESLHICKKMTRHCTLSFTTVASTSLRIVSKYCSIERTERVFVVSITQGKIKGPNNVTILVVLLCKTVQRQAHQNGNIIYSLKTVRKKKNTTTAR